MSNNHAICSPSGAPGWMRCAGWEGGSGSSKYSRLGTAAHELAAKCLLAKEDAAIHLHTEIEVEGELFVVDLDMIDAVQVYLDLVRDLGGDLHVEVKLPISLITGETDAEGTSDAVALFPKEICCVDYKHGQGESVYAEENEQLQMYALAALEEFGFVNDFETARLIIVQPRINNISEWSLPIPKLLEFGKKATLAAKNKLSGSTDLNPGERQCGWCAKKATCSALASFVSKNTESQFDIITDDVTPETLNLVELWIKGKRSDIEKRLLSGEKVPHWKLVRGKQGHRKWTDEESVEEILIQDCGLATADIYDMSLQSPTAIEKLLKNDEENWSALEKLITRTEGKLSVAPINDKRKEVTTLDAQAGFENLDNEEGE